MAEEEFKLERRTEIPDYMNDIERELLKHNTIVLHGELGEENCNRICKQLLYLGYKGAKEITVIMNSVGGEVYHALLIFNTLESLRRSGLKIIIEARGICASMGTIILMGASVRKATKYSRFLLHEVAGYSFGKASEVKEESEELMKLNKMLDEIISSHSKITLEKLKKMTKKREWWLSAEQAFRQGLVDEIV